MARPTRYTKKLAEKICDQLSEGRSLRAICRRPGMPHERTVRRWVLEDRNGFASQYRTARDLGLDAMADEILDIADNAIKSDIKTARLKFDARRWYLSKLAPKRYGDRLQQDINEVSKSRTVTIPIDELFADEESMIGRNCPGYKPSRLGRKKLRK